MLIDLTYSCSMGCSHCMSDCKPDNRHMSVQTASDVLDFLIKNKIAIWMFSGGEMFENPDILAILDVVQEKFDTLSCIEKSLTFATNGRILARTPELYEYVDNMRRKYGKRMFIQVTNDPRYYPDKLNSKEIYRLNKLKALIDTVPSHPSDATKILYPQGRALINYPDSNWNTIGPKCANARLAVMQGADSISKLYACLTTMHKFCTPAIAPDGSIKLGESALCPPVASIYDSDEDIIKKISQSNCRACKIPWERLKTTNPIVYDMLS